MEEEKKDPAKETEPIPTEEKKGDKSVETEPTPTEEPVEESLYQQLDRRLQEMTEVIIDTITNLMVPVSKEAKEAKEEEEEAKEDKNDWDSLDL